MDQAPLKLYVNKAFVASDMSYAALLYPFWGMGTNKDYILYVDSSLGKHGFDPSYFKLVDSPEEAEYILVPHEFWRLKRSRPDLLELMVQEAQMHHKPLLVDASGDVSGVVSIPYANVKVLRMNQYRFDAPSYEVKVPVPCEDLLESYCNNKLQLRQKSPVATIGFVGWGNLSLKQRIRSFVKEIPIRVRALGNKQYAAKIKGVFWRERVNRIFKNSNRIKTNFIIRSSYSGNTFDLQGNKEKNRREFIDNILNTDYTLVIRGDANEATRFYEVLSLGRIPVLIDTAVVLPLEQLINYHEFCVIVDHTDVKRAPEILADFHAKLSPEKFTEMQQKARDAFEQYLRYDSFSPYLVRLLRTNV